MNIKKLIKEEIDHEIYKLIMYISMKLIGVARRNGKRVSQHLKVQVNLSLKAAAAKNWRPTMDFKKSIEDLKIQAPDEFARIAKDVGGL